MTSKPDESTLVDGNSGSSESTANPVSGNSASPSTTAAVLEPDPVVQSYLESKCHLRLTTHVCTGSTCSVWKTVELRDDGKLAAQATSTTSEAMPSPPLASKVICHARVPSKYLHQLMPSELAIVQMVCHRNVIRVHSVHLSLPGYSIIVTELAEGGDLLMHLQKHPETKMHQHRKWFTDITEGLRYLHSIQVGHRDLKADNVLLCGDNNRNPNHSTNHQSCWVAKIGDFGFATRFDPSTPCVTYCGTPEYAAPEILSHTPYCVSQSDCFSLGVLLFLVVMRQLPFGHGPSIRTRSGIFRQYCRIQRRQWYGNAGGGGGGCSHSRAVVQTTLDRDSELRSLLTGLLDPQPSDRLTAAQVLTHPWVLRTQ